MICLGLLGQVSSLLGARDVAQVWAAPQGAAELSWPGMITLMGGLTGLHRHVGGDQRCEFSFLLKSLSVLQQKCHQRPH